LYHSFVTNGNLENAFHISRNEVTRDAESASAVHILQIVAPKQAKLAIAATEFAVLDAALAKKKESLRAVEAKLEKLEKNLKTVEDKKARLEAEVAYCQQVQEALPLSTICRMDQGKGAIFDYKLRCS
jgi:septal ring factor EnvC (AmiA/AmiB activator)